MSVPFANTDHLKQRLDPTDGDDICNVMKLPLTKRRYKHDAVKDEVSNIEFLKDGTVFLGALFELNRLSLRQKFGQNMPDCAC